MLAIPLEPRMNGRADLAVQQSPQLPYRTLPVPDAAVERLLDQAAARGRRKAVPYAGLVTPQEAHHLLEVGRAKLVDVRTRAEWELVGHVPGSELVEWQRYPDGVRNAQFLQELSAHARLDDVVLFLCRSGQRSHHAAVAAAGAGYAFAYNVVEGFEGDRDASGRRGNLGGWRRHGLPWLQA